MKNSIKHFIGLFVMLLGFASNAQFGVSGGLGASDLSVRDNDDIGTIYAGFSFQMGGSFEAELGDIVSLVPGLRFTYNSAKDIDLDKIKAMYLNVPLDVKVYFVDLEGTRIYALGGAYFGYLLSAKFNTTRLTIGNTNNDDVRPLDGGARIGAGVQLFDALNLDIAVDIGIVNIDGGEHLNGYRELNRGFRLTATYQFW